MFFKKFLVLEVIMPEPPGHFLIFLDKNEMEKKNQFFLSEKKFRTIKNVIFDLKK